MYSRLCFRDFALNDQSIIGRIEENCPVGNEVCIGDFSFLWNEVRSLNESPPGYSGMFFHLVLVNHARLILQQAFCFNVSVNLIKSGNMSPKGSFNYYVHKTSRFPNDKICHSHTYGTKYSRMGQVKLVEDSLKKIWTDMVCLSRPYPFKFFEGCLPQILLCPSLNTLSHALKNPRSSKRQFATINFYQP